MKIDIFLIVVGLMFILVSGLYFFKKLKSKEGWKEYPDFYMGSSGVNIVTDSSNPPSGLSSEMSRTSPYSNLYSKTYVGDNYDLTWNKPLGVGGQFGNNPEYSNLHCNVPMTEFDYGTNRQGYRTLGLKPSNGGWGYCMTDSQYKTMANNEAEAARKADLAADLAAGEAAIKRALAAALAAAEIRRKELEAAKAELLRKELEALEEEERQNKIKALEEEKRQNKIKADADSAILRENIKTITGKMTTIKNKYTEIFNLNNEIDTKTSIHDKTNSCSILAENQLKIDQATAKLSELTNIVDAFKIEAKNKYESLQGVITYLNTKLPYNFATDGNNNLTCSGSEPSLLVRQGATDKDIFLQFKLPGTQSGIRGIIGKYGDQGLQGDRGQQGDSGSTGYWGS